MTNWRLTHCQFTNCRFTRDTNLVPGSADPTEDRDFVFSIAPPQVQDGHEVDDGVGDQQHEDGRVEVEPGPGRSQEALGCSDTC